MSWSEAGSQVLGAISGGVALMIAATGVAEGPSPAVAAFDRFVATSSPTCVSRPSAACVEAGWTYADANADDQLSLVEMMAVKSTLSAWAIWSEQRLSARERGGIALGLWIVELVGLDDLFRSYDTDRSGALSRAEFLADVRLDSRPLGEVLSDPEAVDRKALGARVDALAPLVEGLLADGGKGD
jgi:hypothetical protein